MATPFPPPLAGYYFKVVIFIDLSGNGWSDTWYYRAQGNLTIANAWADVVKATKKMAQERNKMLGQGARIKGARVTLIDDTPGALASDQQSLPIPAAQLGVGAVGGSSGPISAQLSCITTVHGTINGLKRSWEVRGFSLDAFKFDPEPPFAIGIGASITAAMNDFGFAMFRDSAAPFAGSFCEKARIRPNTPASSAPDAINLTPSNKVLDFTVDATYRTQVYTITTPDPNPYVVGYQFLARDIRLDCGKGANGLRTVRSVVNGTPAGKTVITTTTRWACQGDPIVKKWGFLYPNKFGLYALYDAVPLRVGSRDTGPPTTRTRGRRSPQAV